jgi:hypothetical protein
MQIDLSDKDTAALAQLMTNTIDNDRYPPLAPHSDASGDLGKIRPEAGAALRYGR